MVCIYCGHDTTVTNSRHQKRVNAVWRRRHCDNCGAVFTTTEVAETSKALLVRQAEALEPFERDKLFISVHDSLKHRKSALTDATALTATILSQLYGLTDSGVIERDSIIEVTGIALQRFDPVANTHYAAFHR